MRRNCLLKLDRSLKPVPVVNGVGWSNPLRYVMR
jgi:hypothetical protein